MRTLTALGFIVATLAILCALILIRPHAFGAQKATGAAEPTRAAERPSSRARPVSAPPPILPVTGRAGQTAEGMPDPTWRNWSHWIMDKGPVDMSQDGQAKSRAMARSAYDHFLERARLSSEQRERFDAALRADGSGFADLSRRVVKDGISQDQFAEGMDKLEHDGYARVKAILTPEQYDVFLREIGRSFQFVATYLRQD